MPGVIATLPKLQFSSLTGVPLAGGTLDVYLAGTTTRATTWQDSSLTSANTNPVVLDSRGACVIWLNSTTAYKLVLKNSAGVSQWTQDNIVGGGVSGAIELAAAAIEAARTESAASAAAALATQTAINDIYYGARSSDPATKPSGAARAVGDEYFNTSAGLLKRWNGAGWQASDISTANLAASGGAGMVVNGTQPLSTILQSNLRRVVASIAALRGIDKTRYTQAVTSGYSALNDGGGAAYYYDAADTTSADNGGSIIVAADGGRWKLLPTGLQNPRQHGAVGTGDVGAALQKMFTQGGGWTIPSGAYKFSAGLTADYSDAAFPEIGYPSIRHSIAGDSAATTRLEYTGAGTAITATGSGVAIGQGVHSFDRLADFSIYPTARAKTENGITLVRKAYTTLENVAIDWFGTGLKLDSCLTSTVRNVHSRNNNYGLILDDTTNFSRPNALVFERLTLLSNAYAGAICNVAGASVKFIGLNVEQNGRHATAGDGGFLGNIKGDNGLASLSFDAPYFEGNGGDGDLVLDNVTALPVTVIISGGCFNRINNTKFTTNNIIVGSSGGGKLTLILIGVGFLSAGSYVPSAARPFIKYDSKCEVIDIGCTYSETVSMPTQLSAATTQAGRSNDLATVTTNPQGVTTTRNAAGIYTVQRLNGFSSSADGYVATAICNFTGGGRKVERITQAANSFQIVITDNAGTLADGDFSWTLTRVKA